MRREDFKAAALRALGVKRRTYNREVPAALQTRTPFADFARWDMDKALKDGYEISEWVNACVNAYARHVSSVPWRVSEFASPEAKSRFVYEYKAVPASQRNDFLRDAHNKKLGFGGRYGFERKSHLIPKPNDPLEQLLEEPNPFTTRQEFMTRLVQHMLLGGNGIQVKVRGSVPGIRGYKTPFELWPLFPQAVDVDTEGQVPTKYRYHPKGKNVDPGSEKEYEPQDVLHFKLVAPRDAIWGMTPLMAAARAVDTDTEILKWNYNSAKNRFVPDLLIDYEDKLTPDAYQTARNRLRRRQGAEGARQPLISGQPVKVNQLSLSPIEMDYIRSRGLNRQSICTIYNIFPPVIAVMEGVSIGNISAVLKHHWIQTIIPFLDLLMGRLNLNLVPDFGNPNKFIWYDTNGVDALAEEHMERVRATKVLHTEGVPLKVLNDRYDLGLNLEGVPLSDEPIFPAGVVTATMIQQGLTGGGPSANPDVPPEGGEPIEPGDGTEPNEPDPEDVTPNDPGENPDTTLSLSALSNGKSDPHHGKKRWTYEGAKRWLEARSVKLLYSGQGLVGDDWHEFWWEDAPSGVVDEVLKMSEEEGIEYDEEGGIFRFYHGDRTQERRERLMERARNWGYSV